MAPHTRLHLAPATQPRRKAVVDYAGATVPIHNREADEIYEAAVFVATLGFNNYIFAEATSSQQSACWIGSHIRAFEFFGGWVGRERGAVTLELGPVSWYDFKGLNGQFLARRDPALLPLVDVERVRAGEFWSSAAASKIPRFLPGDANDGRKTLKCRHGSCLG